LKNSYDKPTDKSADKQIEKNNNALKKARHKECNSQRPENTGCCYGHYCGRRSYQVVNYISMPVGFFTTVISENTDFGENENDVKLVSLQVELIMSSSVDITGRLQ